MLELALGKDPGILKGPPKKRSPGHVDNQIALLKKQIPMSSKRNIKFFDGYRLFPWFGPLPKWLLAIY